MSLNEQLVRKIDELDVKDIALIVVKLQEEFFDDTVKVQVNHIATQNIELNSENIEPLRELLKLVVQQDDAIAKTIDQIRKKDRDSTNKDGGIAIMIAGTGFEISLTALAMLFAYGWGRDLIKAHYPSRVEEDGKVVARDYDDSVANFIKSFAPFFKKDSDNAE